MFLYNYSLILIVVQGVMFCEVVLIIIYASVPDDVQLLSLGPISKQISAHVPTF